MTGSCERNACISARFEAEAEAVLVAHRPGEMETYHLRQGISSTDKDVITPQGQDSKAGGFSSSRSFSLTAVLDFAGPKTNAGRPFPANIALVDGRNGEGLDSGVVSVKLPSVKQKAWNAHRAAAGCELPENSGAKGIADLIRAACRRWFQGCLRHNGGLSVTWREPTSTGGADPAAMRLIQTGNKAGPSCFMRTSGATST